jgi:hypothetical protein
LVTELPTYRYRFASPAAKPIGSSLTQRPVWGSYQRARLYCRPLSESQSRPVYWYRVTALSRLVEMTVPTALAIAVRLPKASY